MGVRSPQLKTSPEEASIYEEQESIRLDSSDDTTDATSATLSDGTIVDTSDDTMDGKGFIELKSEDRIMPLMVSSRLLVIIVA